MNNKKFTATVAIPAAAANLLNPPTVTGGVNGGSSPCYLLIQHLHVMNTSSGAVSVSLWLGATGGSAAGTELAFPAKSVPAHDSVDFYSPGIRIDSTQFLTGLAGSVSTLVLTATGEIGVA